MDGTLALGGEREIGRWEVVVMSISIRSLVREKLIIDFHFLINLSFHILHVDFLFPRIYFFIMD